MESPSRLRVVYAQPFATCETRQGPFSCGPTASVSIKLTTRKKMCKFSSWGEFILKQQIRLFILGQEILRARNTDVYVRFATVASLLMSTHCPHSFRSSGSQEYGYSRNWYL